MSSKSTRKTTTTTTTTSSSVASSSGSQQKEEQRGRSSSRQSTSASASKSSPLSPTRYSRLHEKEELANLNDRLANYIDKVRHLEAENSRLTRELRTTEETITREETKVKSMYENELSEVRKVLDELSKDKAKLEIDVRRLINEKEELNISNDKLKKDLQIAQSSLSHAESRLNDCQGKYNQAIQDKRKLADENKQLEKELNKLNNLLSQKEKALENEILSRVELENSYQTLREEIAFKEQVHQQQLSECRTKKQIEISEIDGRLTQEYEDKLYQSLQELRDQYENDLQNNKDEIKLLYEEKIKSLSSQVARNSNAAAMAMDELRQIQSRGNNMKDRIEQLEMEVNHKNQLVRDLEKRLESDKSKYISDISNLDQELTRLREEMAKQVQEYQDLMDIKVALDMEIAAYRKLLEGEEERLNITPAVSPSARPAARRSTGRAKRKRTFFEESEQSVSQDYSIQSSASGDMEISDVCKDGKFIKVRNKGNKDMVLGGWILTQKAGQATTSFKFYRLVSTYYFHLVLYAGYLLS